MFGKPTWPAVAVLAIVLIFVGVMYWLGAKDVAAIGGVVGALVTAVMKTAGEQ